MSRPIKNHHPRWRKSSIGDTARDAAKTMAPDHKAPTLRKRVLDIVADHGPIIPERAFARLRDDGVSTVLTSVRPRFSELARMGLIVDSGQRERAEGGCNAIAWRLATPEETAAYLAAREAGQ